jgi:hypothetical protein
MLADQFIRRWHNEVFPPPEGAEMTTIKPGAGALIANAFVGQAIRLP